MRKGIILRCNICQEENYITKKNKNSTKIEIKKHCFKCLIHTLHIEKNK